MIDSFSLMTFNDVKVFAGKIGYIADASYKNLLWENIPISPDILFHVYTPTIVSLYNSTI